MSQEQLAYTVRTMKQEVKAKICSLERPLQQPETSQNEVKHLRIQLADASQQSASVSAAIRKFDPNLAQEPAATKAVTEQLHQLQADQNSTAIFSKAQLQSAAILLAADAQLAAAGHQEVLLNSAKALLTGHLPLRSWIAQRMKTIASNLCKDSTHGWRFPKAEMRFVFPLYNTH